MACAANRARLRMLPGYFITLYNPAGCPFLRGLAGPAGLARQYDLFNFLVLLQKRFGVDCFVETEAADIFQRQHVVGQARGYAKSTGEWPILDRVFADLAKLELRPGMGFGRRQFG